MMRVQLPVRAVISGASVSLALAILILGTTSPAVAEENQKQAATDFEPPQLLYLTWQEENPRDPKGKHFPVWKPDGELLDNKATAALRKQLQGFALSTQREDQHHPFNYPKRRDLVFLVP